ncbi:MAG: UDP-4-amino-4,6-dideoxy-N-acetyl-beta-L-altrosamine transaminase [Alphaproteobacteria bacterium]|nr:UDP-4-amino-4,6-dideoxy-N-acetyl-beta-L-altrosamine transaminase [Alphaproteobacteria bacterium]
MNAPGTPHFLPYARQVVDEDDIAAVVAALRGELLTTGPAVEAFEGSLAHAVGASHAVACANGSAALHLAAMALDLRPGEAAIVPSVTFVATANAVAHTGARVVFADVDPETGLMTAETFKAALLSSHLPVRAVFNVHLAGQVGDVEGIAAVAQEHGLAIVEDAAHALGATYTDEHGMEHRVGACYHADLTTFSFHPAKIATMGEGGAVTMRDGALDERVRRERSHGITREPARFALKERAFDDHARANPWYYEIAAPGFNYRASDINCALGTSQLGKLPDNLARRRALADAYDRLLAPLGHFVQPLARVPGCRSAWHLYVVRIDFAGVGRSRSEVMRGLNALGIGTQVNYIPVHRQPYYRAIEPALDLPGAESYYDAALSLPMWAGLEEADLERVAAGLSRALGLD